MSYCGPGCECQGCMNLPEHQSINEDSSDDSIADDYSEQSESEVDDLNYYTEEVEMEIVTDVLDTYIM